MKGPGEKALWCRPRQEGSGACWAPPPGGEAARRAVPVEEHSEVSCLGIQPRPRLPRERPGTAKSKPEDSKCH